MSQDKNMFMYWTFQIYKSDVMSHVTHSLTRTHARTHTKETLSPVVIVTVVHNILKWEIL
jgi:hypothetical protein